jgi:hypothetical protein
MAITEKLDAELSMHPSGRRRSGILEARKTHTTAEIVPKPREGSLFRRITDTAGDKQCCGATVTTFIRDSS